MQFLSVPKLFDFSVTLRDCFTNMVAHVWDGDYLPTNQQYQFFYGKTDSTYINWW